MLLNFFKKAEHKLDDLKEGLIDLHAASQKKLHETHPHINKILKKHNIDPEKVRQAAPRVLVASALLGAFLAYPHLFGKPQAEEPKTETAAHVAIAKKQPAQKAKVESKKEEAKSNASQSSQGTGGSENKDNRGKEDKKVEEETKKSQGHIYGRSAMAPPKEHGLHDLGLHKGEDNNPTNPEKGPHPEELNVVHNEEGAKDK